MTGVQTCALPISYLQAQTRGHLCVVSFPSPTWLDDLKASYEEDEKLRSIVSRLQVSGGR